jgi:uncharacterized protein (TIGR04540 family)
LYWKSEISETELVEWIQHYSSEESEKLFKNGEINPTISLIVGKKRLDLILKLIK